MLMSLWFFDFLRYFRCSLTGSLGVSRAVFYQCYISFNELMQLFFYFEGLESIRISNLDRI